MRKRIIYLLIIVFSFITLGFLSIKNTNAYSYNVDSPYITYNLPLNQGSGFAYIFDSDMLANGYVIKLSDNVGFVCVLELSRYKIFRYFDRQGNMDYEIDLSNSISNLFYLQFCWDYVENKMYFYINSIQFTITNRQDDSPIISNISIPTLSYYLEIDDNTFKSYYLSQQANINVTFGYSAYPNERVYGLFDLYSFDIQNNFSNAIDEQVEFLFNDIKGDIPVNYYNYLINLSYYRGYGIGYNTGDYVGYTRGYNEGNNEGYNDGYQDGFEDGVMSLNAYDSGYDDGYSIGYTQGIHDSDAYDIGYSTGYYAGYDAGEQAETAINPVFSILANVFTAVGTILEIKLGPGLTIGTLVFIPLFFAVIGFILWIWRRN